MQALDRTVSSTWSLEVLDLFLLRNARYPVELYRSLESLTDACASVHGMLLQVSTHFDRESGNDMTYESASALLTNTCTSKAEGTRA